VKKTEDNFKCVASVEQLSFIYSFILCPFNVALNSSDTASNGCMINELEKILKEGAVALYELLLRYLPRETEKYH
jgi:hypothetical protein